MSRIEELYDMQRQIDAEIKDELAALQRIAELRDHVYNAVSSNRADVVHVMVSAAEWFGIDLDALTSGSRLQEAVDARHVASWLLHGAGFTYVEIGRTFSQDHSTVMNAVARVNRTPRLRAIADSVHSALPAQRLASARSVG